MAKIDYNILININIKFNITICSNNNTWLIKQIKKILKIIINKLIIMTKINNKYPSIIILKQILWNTILCRIKKLIILINFKIRIMRWMKQIGINLFKIPISRKLNRIKINIILIITFKI